MYSIISSASTLLSSSDSFFFFLSLIAVSRTSKTMLDKSGENEYPCLVPELTGNAFSFSLVNMLAVGFHGFYYVECDSS